MKKILLVSPLGDPNLRQTWSSAPYNLKCALEDRGYSVVTASTKELRFINKIFAVVLSFLKFGRIRYYSLTSYCRAVRGEIVRRLYLEHLPDHIICTSTLDCPVGLNIPYSLWIDNSLSLLQVSETKHNFTNKQFLTFDRYEKYSLENARFVFPFSSALRSNLINHYACKPEKVVAVGCGCGPLEAFQGSKRYDLPKFLFVAKHLFVEKGGELALNVFYRVRDSHPNATLTIIGNAEIKRMLKNVAGVTVHGFLELDELKNIFNDSNFLLEPMLGDPWGQVFLEAMLCKLIVIGLNRGGLPEIVDNGKLGFLANSATVDDVYNSFKNAMNLPQEELSSIANAAQLKVLNSYTWPNVASSISDVLVTQ